MNWGKLSVISHPTKYAASNSVVVIRSRLSNKPEVEFFDYKKADYVAGVSRLILSVTYDLPGWVSLECDKSKMPRVDAFHLEAERVIIPILDTPSGHRLPEISVRSPKKKGKTQLNKPKR